MTAPDPSIPRLIQKLAAISRQQQPPSTRTEAMQPLPPSAAPSFFSQKDRSIAYIDALEHSIAAARSARERISPTSGTSEALAPLIVAFDAILSLEDTKWLKHARTHADTHQVQQEAIRRFTTLAEHVAGFYAASLTLTEHYLSADRPRNADTLALQQAQGAANYFATTFLNTAALLPAHTATPHSPTR